MLARLSATVVLFSFALVLVVACGGRARLESPDMQASGGSAGAMGGAAGDGGEAFYLPYDGPQRCFASAFCDPDRRCDSGVCVPDEVCPEAEPPRLAYTVPEEHDWWARTPASLWGVPYLWSDVSTTQLLNLETGEVEQVDADFCAQDLSYCYERTPVALVLYDRYQRTEEGWEAVRTRNYPALPDCPGVFRLLSDGLGYYVCGDQQGAYLLDLSNELERRPVPGSAGVQLFSWLLDLPPSHQMLLTREYVDSGLRSVSVLPPEGGEWQTIWSGELATGAPEGLLARETGWTFVSSPVPGSDLTFSVERLDDSGQQLVGTVPDDIGYALVRLAYTEVLPKVTTVAFIEGTRLVHAMVDLDTADVAQLGEFDLPESGFYQTHGLRHLACGATEITVYKTNDDRDREFWVARFPGELPE